MMKASTIILFIICLLNFSSTTYASTYMYKGSNSSNTNNSVSHAKPASQYYQTYQAEHPTPNFIAMLGDALIVRPIYFVATILGTGTFLLTVPFTMFTGSLDKEASMLIATPFHETFTRCLGCETKIDKAMNE